MAHSSDSYDKLKPYGFMIKGCIDGYSIVSIIASMYNYSTFYRLLLVFALV